MHTVQKDPSAHPTRATAHALSAVGAGQEEAVSSADRSILPVVRTTLSRLGPAGPSTALLAAGICLIAMQVTYSYVELGIESGRLMLLLGVMLGILGRTYAPRPPRVRRPRWRRSQSGTTSEAPRAAASGAADPAIDRGAAVAPIGSAGGLHV